MRKVKVLPLEVAGKKEVTIKEVSPYGVYKAMLAEDKMGELTALALDCIDLSPEQLQGLYASEIEQLVDGAMEVNSSFLGIADKLGLKRTLTELAGKALNSLPQLGEEVLKNLPPAFATLFSEAMAKVPGIMDGDSSSSPSTPSPVIRSK
jgi:hypothetical protein